MRAFTDKTLATPAIPLRHVVAVVMGNGLEFYDFLCYAIYAVYIGKTFFPAGDETASLLLSLATFGIGFITRPIGGVVLGMLGDRIGRKPAMLLSFALMGAGMLGVALTPGYAQIGLAAPILVIVFRLVQGFALGGEVGPATAYLIEAAPVLRRGYFGSMQLASQRAATLIASIIGISITSALGDAEVARWAWRVPFLLGVVIVPFGMIIRRNLPETLHAADDAALAPDATSGSLQRAPIGKYLPVLISGLFLLAGATIGYYIITYGTTYAMRTLHLPASTAFAATIVSSITGFFGPLAAGAVSDRVGRKPVLVFGIVSLAVTIVPGFWLMTQYPSALTVCAVFGVLSALTGLSSAPVITALTEGLPKRIRSGAVATVYALAISIFGGTTQFVITWLMQVTGSPLAPAWYWTAAVTLTLLVVPFLPETAPVKLARGTD